MLRENPAFPLTEGSSSDTIRVYIVSFVTEYPRVTQCGWKSMTDQGKEATVMKQRPNEGKK